MLKKISHFIGPRTRSRYWSTSNLAKALQHAYSFDKPSAATLEDWDAWKEETQRRHPIIYWLTEELPDNVQSVVMFPADLLNATRYYCYNRFVMESHKLRSDLAPGQFHEFDTRLLHCLFTDLARFVEIEKAHIQVAFNEENRKNYGRPWHHDFYFLRWTQWRHPQAGLDYLQWEMSLKEESYDHSTGETVESDTPSQQASAAAEILALYQWWKTRAQRPDPYDAAGYTAFSATLPECQGLSDRNLTQEQRLRQSELFKKVSEIEQQHEAEDEEMLLRLIKIRKHIWT